MSSSTIVAINGSERRDGNTADVLDFAAKILAKRDIELDVIRLADLAMTPCGPCGDCNSRTVPCEVNDGVAGAVRRMAAGDGIIYAAPGPPR